MNSLLLSSTLTIVLAILRALIVNRRLPGISLSRPLLRACGKRRHAIGISCAILFERNGMINSS
jgi:hypothetical protein